MTETANRGRFEHLPTLAEMQAHRRLLPKAPTPQAKLDRAVEKKKSDGIDRAKLNRWAAKVKKRDQWIDRCDGKPVLRTDKPDPRRGEAHHIVSRSDKAVRYDVRNGITLSFENHTKVELNQLKIVGTKWFTINGKRYIDATHPVSFTDEKGAPWPQSIQPSTSRSIKRTTAKPSASS